MKKVLHPPYNHLKCTFSYVKMHALSIYFSLQDELHLQNSQNGRFLTPCEKNTFSTEVKVISLVANDYSHYIHLSITRWFKSNELYTNWMLVWQKVVKWTFLTTCEKAFSLQSKDDSVMAIDILPLYEVFFYICCIDLLAGSVSVHTYLKQLSLHSV